MPGLAKDWKSSGLIPYVHWWAEKENLYPDALDAVGYLTGERIFDARDVSSGPVKGYKDKVPIPKGVANAKWFRTPFAKWLPADLKTKTPGMKEDSVIVGIIDEGIALGHERFRQSHGKTRFLAAWLQGSEWQGKAQDYLPFGRELYRADLDTAIEDHSRGRNPEDWLDEDAFNRDVGLVEPERPLGPRALMRHATHGTMTLDLATGAAPDQDGIDRLPIIAVGLPRRETVGIGGIFLEYFLFFAIRRIIDMADAIWAAHFPDTPGSFPIVINLSYGQHSGPKDGRSLFETEVRKLIDTRAGDGKAPLRVVMPLGNDNLLRGNARWNLYPDDEDRMNLGWMIPPQDHSSNFAEIWGPVIWDQGRPPKLCPLAVRLSSPLDPMKREWRGKDGEYLDLPVGSARPYARIYCRRVEVRENRRIGHRFQYLLCVLRTAHSLPVALAPTAPAGLWRLRVVNRAAEPLECYVMVQVDQAPAPYGVTTRRSYFLHEKYETHQEDGRARDSFDYPVDASDENGSNLEPARTRGPMQRKGTHNALANLPDHIAVLGGYRASDGRPADYSATTHGKRTQGELVWPTAALPTEDGPMHFGVMGAGSKSGSTVAMRGTSFASAMATRLVAQDLLEWATSRRVWLGSPLRLRALGQLCDPVCFPDQSAASMKVGAGRIPAPVQGRIGRKAP